MAKDNINKNFENLKAEMMKKKEHAKNVDTNINENKDRYDRIDIHEDEYTKMEVSEPEILQNKIIIKKAQKLQPPKRITYYLKPETIKKIEKYSKLTGMGKSELVQTLLELSLNNLEVE